MEWIATKDYLPQLPEDVDPDRYGIGLVGCGTIANQAHLPAYRKIGLRVVACCDVNEEAARRTAEAFDIPFWTTKVSELLEREDVAIVDLAVHPEARMGILEEIAKAPRPVLCQKPLAIDLQQAYLLGRYAEKHGIVLGVNQQARFAPAHKALRLLLDRGLVGEPFYIQHVMRSFQDMEGWWWTNMPDFNIVDHGVHYLDLCRYFSQAAGNPAREWNRLHCTTAQLPDQISVSPMVYSANLEFGGTGGRESFMASMQFNNIVRSRTSHSYNWWVDGSEGSVFGNQEKLYVSLAKEGSVLHEIRLKGTWFPDGFAGSMAGFIAAVARGEKPPVTAEDNYNTVAMTTAMVVSSREGRMVGREEIRKGAGLDENESDRHDELCLS